MKLHDVTLVGIDCYRIHNLVRAMNICRHYCEFDDVKIMTSMEHEDPDIVKIKRLSFEGYNEFVIKELHKYIDTSHALLVQHDGFILNPYAWTNKFMEYDYIGAPWFFKDSLNVGNGGFSLRSNRFLKVTSKYIVGPPWVPEDTIVCRRYGKLFQSGEKRRIGGQ